MNRAQKKTWQVQEAKTHLSSLIDIADQHGPQMITKHGAERALVISVNDYRALRQNKDSGEEAPDFKAWLMSFPKVKGLQIRRASDVGSSFSFEDFDED